MVADPGFQTFPGQPCLFKGDPLVVGLAWGLMLCGRGPRIADASQAAVSFQEGSTGRWAPKLTRPTWKSSRALTELARGRRRRNVGAESGEGETLQTEERMEERDSRPTVKAISLRGPLGPEGGAAIAEGLKGNSTLQSLK